MSTDKEKVLKSTLNYIMRNIDLKVYDDDESDLLYSLEIDNDELLRAVATAVRSSCDPVHAMWQEIDKLLHPLALSLTSQIVAKVNEFDLIKSYSVDEEEDIQVELNIKECKRFIKFVKEILNNNYVANYKVATHEAARNSDYIVFVNG
jgi:hypothetical protein